MNLTPEDESDLYELLRDIEWVYECDEHLENDGTLRCPSCRSRVGKHDDNCELKKWKDRIKEAITP